MTETEEWRAVGDGWPYEVSDIGRVRSISRTITSSNGYQRRLNGRVLRGTPSDSGHLLVDLCDGGRRWNAKVHVLVAAAFYGPRPEGMETRHLDGDPTNNRVENLRYGTRSENHLDRVLHGTHKNAAKTHCPQGHPYSGGNLSISHRSNGHEFRRCRACLYADLKHRRAAS
ncbi:NUMOD4 motif-containing HNH endonuclease [Tsukamurella sp. DT100]|uniref:NUMOD4 motif-containing HNH endonuclease n=1 Tax=Tsukamurella sp. DT100 TaxID=3393415 RepID=UPI003CEFFF4E